MNSVGDSFAWAFRDPAWPGKILLQGLIAIIPIIGWIAMNGWLMMAFENARAGKNELPPAGFHLERGIGISVVLLVYGVVLGIPGGLISGLGFATASHTDNSFNTSSPLIAFGYLLSFVGSLLFTFLIPSLVVHTFHGGISGGFDVPRVWTFATLNVTNSIVAGVIVYVASIIGWIGFLCCIGFIFTIPYQNTINGGVIAWFERAQATPAPPAAPAPPLPPTA
jgi:hypothetical protein